MPIGTSKPAPRAIYIYLYVLAESQAAGSCHDPTAEQKGVSLCVASVAFTHGFFQKGTNLPSGNGMQQSS